MQEPPAIMEAAADWLMRRHVGLDAAEERAFSAWLAQSPDHARAFEQLAGPWFALDEIAGNADIVTLRAEALQAAPAPAASPARRWPRALAASLAGLAVAGGSWWALRPTEPALVTETLETARGQRQNFTLADGSVVTLDADSRVEVTLAPRRRALELRRGQAYFRVAHDRSRPFVVAAGEREVVAVGTEFDVARRPGQITVALAQGRVRVEPTGSFNAKQPLQAGGTELAVGQALLFDQASQRTLIASADIPALTAWREGRLHFERVSLANALADFNRYAAEPLRLGSPSLADMPISGVFRSEDSAGFVRALTQLYPIKAETRSGEIVLTATAPHRD